MFNLGNKEKKKEPLDLREINNEILKLKKENKEIKEEIEKIKEKQQEAVQKVGIIRFNPFKGEGGNQSFSIAILDNENNGFIVTALYNKEGSRVYGKEIKEGSSEYALSEEEKEAILKANQKNSENKNKKNGEKK